MHLTSSKLHFEKTLSDVIKIHSERSLSYENSSPLKRRLILLTELDFKRRYLWFHLSMTSHKFRLFLTSLCHSIVAHLLASLYKVSQKYSPYLQDVIYATVPYNINFYNKDKRCENIL